MFYCQKCGDEHRWPTYYGLPTSYGPCEVCNKRAPCFDVPTSRLPKKAQEADTVDGDHRSA
jgi:hypothetical protein